MCKSFILIKLLEKKWKMNVPVGKPQTNGAIVMALVVITVMTIKISMIIQPVLNFILRYTLRHRSLKLLNIN